MPGQDFFQNYRGKLVVFGHTGTEYLPPELSGYTPEDPEDLWAGEACFGLDTGCGKGGFLDRARAARANVYESRRHSQIGSSRLPPCRRARRRPHAPHQVDAALAEPRRQTHANEPERVEMRVARAASRQAGFELAEALSKRAACRLQAMGLRLVRDTRAASCTSARRRSKS